MELRLDIEVYADRYEDLEALFAELAAEDEEVDDELTSIIQDGGIEWDTWGEAA